MNFEWKPVSEAPIDSREVFAAFRIKAGAMKGKVVYFKAHAHPEPYGVSAPDHAKAAYWAEIPELPAHFE